MDVLQSGDHNCFCLGVIKLEFIIGHPVLNVWIAVRCTSQEGLYVFRGVAVIVFGIAGVKMVFKGMVFDEKEMCMEWRERGLGQILVVHHMYMQGYYPSQSLSSSSSVSAYIYLSVHLPLYLYVPLSVIVCLCCSLSIPHFSRSLYHSLLVSVRLSRPMLIWCSLYRKGTTLVFFGICFYCCCLDTLFIIFWGVCFIFHPVLILMTRRVGRLHAFLWHLMFCFQEHPFPC